MRWFPLFALAACGPFHTSQQAPEQVTPLEGLNTPFDDFNAAKPAHWQRIVWSTNRGSEGQHLDVWTAELAWAKTPRVVHAAAPFEPELMSEKDERGPLVMRGSTFDRSLGVSATDVLAFASDRDGGAGGLDLYWSRLAGRPERPEVVPFAQLNTAANEAYLTLPYGERTAMFATDRESGNYDLWEVTFGGSLDGEVTNLTRVAALSSDRDDTAPYVDRDMLVFASRRDGDDWDLYCANRANGTWSPPKPIAIANSDQDEFRPSLFSIGAANFMVFSSNRTGGAGGYDLYTVRLDGCR
jgi:hypothetical protein